MDVLFETDCDLSLMRARTVAVLGYGNQGRAQALNLRDSGVNVIIGARTGGRGTESAAADGFDVKTPADAVRGADVVAVLTPDETQAALYRDAIAPNVRSGGALVFAHGLAIRFSLIDPRPDLDILLVSPKGPGSALRHLYVEGQGMVALYAIGQDASGQAAPLALSYAAAIGSGRAGILPTSFAEECEADLFNEQAVVWGAVPEILRAGYDTLVEAGVSEEVAYLECVSELKLLADLIYERGIAGMREAISNTAEFGATTGGSRMVNLQTRAAMRQILAEIRAGRFTEQLVADAEEGYPRLAAARTRAASQPLEETGRKLRSLQQSRSST